MIKSTIKVAKLHSTGDLNLMLRYNATQMFIETLNNIIPIGDNNNNQYPINTKLLWSSIRYNNTTVFNHLSFKISWMTIDINELGYEKANSIICGHGNVEIMQRLIGSIRLKSIPNRMINITLLMDTGNEQFVGLVLKHMDEEFGDTDNRDCHNYDNHDNFKFRSRGISVGILKLMNDAYVLYDYSSIWKRALSSVKYIIDHLPDRQMKVLLPYYGGNNSLMIKCLKGCAKVGNFDMFQLLINTKIGAKVLEKVYIVNEARYCGQFNFIQYLIKHSQTGSVANSTQRHEFGLPAWFRSSDQVVL
ncbi:hypothetical protein SAMD00019534_051070 [Acytostelium subglobosum LB1]|uniref:hypothetical protein n=1 Tax=Acytostelium subglobosum LB1 TaxID=1410327 RepID=UPI0006447B38|nr:hypothetical protein SAMD00019534_051070 [Acytostelium subglobosum LB1]GAM21932.1 hypothetical protein SAMD00019534_051070 [Acytostelium subglobosum LB1]|eukprot:XP_012755032.1 hypothetical protein SAMD00019534_051070 [Acytostelium subglobosum LB1]